MIDSLVFTLPFALLDQSKMIVADTSPYNSRWALWVAAPYGDYFQTDREAYYAINSLGSLAGLNTITIQADTLENTRLVTSGGDEIDIRDRILKMTASRLPRRHHRNISFATKTCLDKTPL